MIDYAGMAVRVHRGTWIVGCVMAAAVMASVPIVAQAPPLKIFISVDMEGISNFQCARAIPTIAV